MCRLVPQPETGFKKPIVNPKRTALTLIIFVHVITVIFCVPGRVNSRLLQRLAPSLIQFIEPDFHLLNELVCLKVLDDSERQRVCAENNVSDQNKRLMICLKKKSGVQLQQFLLALDKTGQSHVANWIEFKRDGSEFSCLVTG